MTKDAAVLCCVACRQAANSALDQREKVKVKLMQAQRDSAFEKAHKLNQVSHGRTPAVAHTAIDAHWHSLGGNGRDEPCPAVRPVPVRLPGTVCGEETVSQARKRFPRRGNSFPGEETVSQCLHACLHRAYVTVARM